MKFSYNWLKELAKFKDSPEKLAEFLALRVFEVESIRKSGRDWALDIKLLPNRAADTSGHAGMAMEISSLKNSNFRFPISNIDESRTKKTADVLQIKIENSKDCPRYTARVMEGAKVGPSPKWLRERLETCGIQSINNVVDAANYVMLELGQPLHVFDFDKISGKNKKTIIVRRARKNEKLLALDDKIYPLSPEILVIADQEEPVAIAGIKGGKTSGVSSGTKNLVLESANFDPVRIRIGSKNLALKTDASYRFERGMDPNETAHAVDRLASVIQNIAGGEILQGRADSYPRLRRPARILVRPEYVKGRIGIAFPAQFFDSAFKRLGWEYAKDKKGYIAKPPTSRFDISIEEDVIEELARLWGYENIPAKLPPAHVPQSHDVNERRAWTQRARDILAGAGFTEAYAYEFVGERELADFEASPAKLFELENPSSPQTRFLIDHPLYHFASFASRNSRREPNVNIFGFAKGFSALPRPTRKQPAKETSYLTLACTSARAHKDGGESFFRLKGAIDGVMAGLGVADHWYDDAFSSGERKGLLIFHPYRVAQVKIENELIGVAGELHPRVRERLKVSGRAAIAEINFDALLKFIQPEYQYRAPAKYPAVIRDIAVLVPAGIKADAVQDAIENAGGTLLFDSDLFDYFEDEAMREESKKSLAFHLVFQSPDRTLTDKEVSLLVAKIIRALKSRGWEVRE